MQILASDVVMRTLVYLRNIVMGHREDICALNSDSRGEMKKLRDNTPTALLKVL